MCTKTLSRCVCVVGLLLITTATRTPAAPAAAYGGGVLHVDDDAPPGGDGASWETPYRFLQDALFTAGKGGVGEIRVAQGLYLPDHDEANPDGTGDRDATFQLISGVALRGGYAGLGEPDPDERDIELYVTVLSGDLLGDDEPNFVNYEENSYTVVMGSNTDSTAILDGVTVTAGNSSVDDPPWENINDPNPRQSGAGMLNQNGSPTVIGCIFTANRAVIGAGIYNMVSSATITGCSFVGNSTIGTGGGIRNMNNCHVTVANCAFVGNEVGAGGGIADSWFSSSTVSNCVFVGNVAEGGGGGMVVAYNSALSITDSLFADNIAGGGGGLLIGSGTALIDGCEFVGNSASLLGGGIALGSSVVTLTNCNIYNNISDWIGGGVVDVSSSTFVNCAIGGNSASIGGGLYVFGNAAVFNCTIGANTGNGIDFTEGGGSVTLANAIVWGNTPQQVFGPGDVTATYSDIQGGWPGTGNIDADPLFVQPAGDNLRLGFGSPCIDAGDNDAVPDGITTDLDGLPRFVDDPDVEDTGHGTPPIVDMGAYEGGHEPQDPMAVEDDFDQNEIILLIPNGGPFDPFFNAAVGVINTSGPDNAMFAVTQIDWDLHPGAAGFSELGSILRTETTLKPGQFFMQLYIPFDLEQLQGQDHARLDVTSFDDPSGNWVLAALLNTQDSPDRHGPIGDKIVDDNPDDGWGTTTDFGDWGVVYDANLERGFVWANADYSDDFALGVPFCPADCAPFGGDEVVGVLDLLQVLAEWGLAGASGPCDLDRDDDVDVADLTFLLQSWGSCPQPASYASPTTHWAGVIANRAVVSFRGRLFRGRGDLDANGVVDQRDLHRLQADWGACDNCPSDLDADGVVGSRDLLILLANWGHTETKGG